MAWTARPGRPAIYPWHTWADGGYHVARRDVDFHIPVDQLRIRLSTHAKRLSERATRVEDERRARCASVNGFWLGDRVKTGAVVLRFLRPGDEEFNPYLWMLDQNMVPAEHQRAVRAKAAFFDLPRW